MLIENVDVEGSILAGLDVYVSSHPHFKAITGTRGSVLSKRFILGLRGVKLLRAGWKVKLPGSPHEGEATSSSRNNCLVAGGAVSVISAQRARLMCRIRCRAATLSLPTLSLSSQLLPDEERRSWHFRPENISHGRYAERYACTHVARSVPHERKLTHTGSGSASLRTS